MTGNLKKAKRKRLGVFEKELRKLETKTKTEQAAAVKKPATLTKVEETTI